MNFLWCRVGGQLHREGEGREDIFQWVLNDEERSFQVEKHLRHIHAKFKRGVLCFWKSKTCGAAGGREGSRRLERTELETQVHHLHFLLRLYA